MNLRQLEFPKLFVISRQAPFSRPSAPVLVAVACRVALARPVFSTAATQLI